jgi:type I restriction enzyme R subunit
MGYATNGHDIYQLDMQTGKEELVQRFLSPIELWQLIHADAVPDFTTYWREAFAKVPFEVKGDWKPRYYQENAIRNALEAIARGEARVLLTLATGTGKTCIAFQMAWKLYHSRWSLQGRTEPANAKKRPRILFLADRNVLTNQAFNDFGPFGEDAICRVEPSEIKKKGAVPKNASVFFTIFQTFSSGKDEEGNPVPYFGEYPEDFFDLIIIDECHRGGANDESNWRAILEYFSPAVELGLTATPKRTQNADTYNYFGEPVYSYTLKEGINDGVSNAL